MKQRNEGFAALTSASHILLQTRFFHIETMSNANKDAEEGNAIAVEQAAARRAPAQDTSQKGPGLVVTAVLIFALAIAALIVGNLALQNSNEVEDDLDELRDKVIVICDEETTLVNEFTFPPIHVPAPTHAIFVPAWDYQDPTWFGTVGNRVIHHKDPMYAVGDKEFATPIGFLSGEEVIIKPITTPDDYPVLHIYFTGQFAGKSGDVVFGGLFESTGVPSQLPILGGTGNWEDFSGFVEGFFDTSTFQFSAKLYQTCA